MFGQKMINGKCPKCHAPLSELKDDGVWGIVECACGEWFDTRTYMAAGGELIG